MRRIGQYGGQAKAYFDNLGPDVAPIWPKTGTNETFSAFIFGIPVEEKIAMANHSRAPRTNAVKSRHLVLLIDGTWVSPTRKGPSEQQSNVFWLDLFLEATNRDGGAQMAFYHSGIGAVASNCEKWLGGGLALGLERFVETAYLDIVSNYRKGDKIYIIGFSRGAIVARIVASLISNFGVLNPYRIEDYPKMWKHPQGEKPDAGVETIRTDHYFAAGVEFLGLFDTVPGTWAEGSSVESSVLKKTFFQNRKLPRNVKSALHILSMNESRIEFRPFEFEGVEEEESQHLEQIWMPGVHSDIGGGYTEHFLGNISLITMIDRLRKVGLSLNNGRLEPLKQKIKLEFEEPKNIFVHDEYGGPVWNWPFSRICSKFGWMRRKPMNEHKFQYYHEFCARIETQSIRMKSEPETRVFKLEEYREKGWPKLQFAKVDLLDEILGPSAAQCARTDQDEAA